MTAPLAARRTPRSVRLRVAQDTNRAERIRQLKTAHPELTWSSIGDQIGGREGSAIAWQQTGGLNPKNAEKLADIFGVSYDFLWFGKEKGPTPDVLAGVAGIEHVEAVRDEFRGEERDGEHRAVWRDESRGKVDASCFQLTERELDPELHPLPPAPHLHL